MGPTPSVHRAVCRAAHPAWPRPHRLLPPIQWRPPSQPTLPPEIGQEVVLAPTTVAPELHRVAAMITCPIVEALAGLRPLAQLERHCTPTLIFVMSHVRHCRAGVGLRLRSIRVQSPCAGVLEVTALMNQGLRTRVAALRIVKHQNGWICNHLETALIPHVITRDR